MKHKSTAGLFLYLVISFDNKIPFRLKEKKTCFCNRNVPVYHLKTESFIF